MLLLLKEGFTPRCGGSDGERVERALETSGADQEERQGEAARDDRESCADPEDLVWRRLTAYERSPD